MVLELPVFTLAVVVASRIDLLLVTFLYVTEKKDRRSGRIVCKESEREREKW